MSNNGFRSLDDCVTFAQVTENREKQYLLQKANKDNYEGVLVSIYKEPTHFVYELLQNADDVMATRVKFEIDENELRFYHNGVEDFSLDDVKGITGVGNSTKKNEEEEKNKKKKKKKAGEFGVGFKSVFAVTNEPYVYNRAYNFRIKNMIIPYEVEGRDLGEYTTMFRLPFFSEKMTNEEIVERIRKEFAGIDCATIMFMDCIEELEFPENTIKIERKREVNYEVIRDGNDDENYLRFRDEETNVSIVYKVKDRKIVPCEELYMYSFLPTKVKSGLAFYVDAPFKLATTRESIDFGNDANEKILEQIGEFFEKTLIALRNENYIDAEFLENVLPIDKDKSDFSEIYGFLYGKMEGVFRKNALIPNYKGGFLVPENGVLYKCDIMQKLYPNYPEIWMKIPEDKKKLRKFLKNVASVKEVMTYDFAKTMSEGPIKTKDNDWLVEFYLFCKDNVDEYYYPYPQYYPNYRKYNPEKYWEKMRQLPIIKTRLGSFRSAYAGEVEQVFCPSRGLDQGRIINQLFTYSNKDDVRSMLNNSILSEFLSYMKISERSPKQTIELTIMSRWEKASDEGRKELYDKMCDIFNELSGNEDKEEVVKYLRDKKIFLAMKNGKSEWKAGNEVMVGSEEQKMLFENEWYLADGYFTDVKVKNEKNGKISQTGSADFCLAMGVNDSMPVKTETCEEYSGYATSVPDSIIKNAEYKINKEKYPKIWYSKKYDIDGFSEILDNIDSEEKTKALVVLLAKLGSDECFEDEVSGTLKGNYRKAQEKWITRSEILSELLDKAWVVVNGEKRRRMIFR